MARWNDYCKEMSNPYNNGWWFCGDNYWTEDGQGYYNVDSDCWDPEATIWFQCRDDNDPSRAGEDAAGDASDLALLADAPKEQQVSYTTTLVLSAVAGAMLCTNLSFDRK